MGPATAASHFPGGSAVKKNPPANEEDVGSVPGSEDPLEKEIATHSTYSRLRNPMDRGARWATVHGVAKSRTRLSN